MSNLNGHKRALLNSVQKSISVKDANAYHSYTLEINTLELSGKCPDCKNPVNIYKRQYQENSTGRKVQSYCITPCDCRQETFDPYGGYESKLPRNVDVAPAATSEPIVMQTTLF